MHDLVAQVPTPTNEPVLGYAPGSPERGRLDAELRRIAGEVIEIPCIIGGRRVETGRLEDVVMPHDHGHVLARFHVAGERELEQAIAAAASARREWEATRWESRAAVFLRAAALATGRRRMTLNAATMLGQSKTCHQAEIDAACELIDFWRFNVKYAEELYGHQPQSGGETWNALELRPLEGFVFAMTPFNFSAIAGNLSTAPALMGNTVVWKPAESQTLAAYYTYLLLEEAGVPPGVINFLPGHGQELAPPALAHPDFSGLHFTGSTAVFRSLWKQVGDNIDRYRTYPRLVGETGGKDFIVAHPSADDQALITAIVRGGYEFQGQKCSAASRVYLPESTWSRIRDPLIATIEGLTMGDVADYKNFMGAVIKRDAFARHQGAISAAREASGVDIAAGGVTDDSVGWFVRPTLLVCDDPRYDTMERELFGPIVSAYVYPDGSWDQTLDLVNESSPYGLTGAVFARDRAAIDQASGVLRHAAGNFYVNDKPTGAVVGQQPFGGGRASGTNDKAGSPWNLLRWVSARTVKENLAPPIDYRYPFLG
jgi:1-pyrroline-5-carboxylate dehydrogenase